MQIIEDEELEFNILKVEEGYKLIDKEEQENEEPYYFTKAFLPKAMTLEECEEKFVEVDEDT